MKTIYLVYINKGLFEDNHDVNLFATKQKLKALKFKEKFNNLLDRQKEFLDGKDFFDFPIMYESCYWSEVDKVFYCGIEEIEFR